MDPNASFLPHTVTRRRFTKALMASATALPTIASAQAGAPIRILVGFPPGAGSDAIARLLAAKMRDVLGAPVIVENRSGAGGQLAAQALKASQPDGQTWLMAHDHVISILPQVVRAPGFDPQADFVTVAGFASFAIVLALSSGTPGASVEEYVEWVRRHRGARDSVGVPAAGSIPEFIVQLIAGKYALDLQAAPYRGSAPMVTDMLSGQISAGVGAVPDFIEYHRAGKLRMVAVVGARRQPLLPQVPTFAELGLTNLTELPYYGFFAPKGTPQTVVDRFGRALAATTAMPEVKDRLTSMGLAVGYEPQHEFIAHVRAYTQAWERIIKASGFKPQ